MAIDNEDFHKPSVVIRFAEYLTIDPVNRGATYIGTLEECRRSRRTQLQRELLRKGSCCGSSDPQSSPSQVKDKLIVLTPSDVTALSERSGDGLGTSLPLFAQVYILSLFNEPLAFDRM